jgi:hypothetical protein
MGGRSRFGAYNPITTPMTVKTSQMMNTFPLGREKNGSPLGKDPSVSLTCGLDDMYEP